MPTTCQINIMASLERGCAIHPYTSTSHQQSKCWLTDSFNTVADSYLLTNINFLLIFLIAMCIAFECGLCSRLLKERNNIHSISLTFQLIFTQIVTLVVSLITYSFTYHVSLNTTEEIHYTNEYLSRSFTSTQEAFRIHYSDNYVILKFSRATKIIFLYTE